MKITTRLSAIVSILLAGAIFGFFYAWICSTMWGLDAADPRIAISAMQAMNASVRNVVFAPAFFATPFALALAAFLLWRDGLGRAAAWFLSAALVYVVFGFGLTMTVNVPMNEALATVAVPAGEAEARAIWDAYSQPWQMWNTTRTVASGLALLLAVIGITNASAVQGQRQGA